MRHRKILFALLLLLLMGLTARARADDDSARQAWRSALLHFSRQEYEAANEMLVLAIDHLGLTRKDALVVRAYARYRTYRADTALADLEMADTSWADPVWLTMFHGCLLGEQLSPETYQRALNLMSRAIEKRPQALYFALRGQMHHRRQHQFMAIADYDRAITLDPGDPAVYLLRARAFMEAGPGRVAESEKDLATAERLDPTHTRSVLVLPPPPLPPEDGPPRHM